MHLQNGIICPMTGIPMLIIAGSMGYFAYRKAKENFSKDKILYTVMLTCFVFALQMINFAIPETSSSGHIIGATLLSILLGPNVAFLMISAIIVIQAIFFMDGGLMALGCNIINMGAVACFVAYPLFYKSFEKINKPILGAFIASIIALQLGSIGVILESSISGSIIASSIPKFTNLMQTIHLPIGIVEGIFSGLILLLSKKIDYKKMSILFGTMSAILSVFIAQYASIKPDGLEWSLLNIENSVILQTQNQWYIILNSLQNKMAIFTNYNPILANAMGILIMGILAYVFCLLINSRKSTEI